ncbi:hypothetical protein K9M74_02630 [Candidatus Woesearchaeota archaeon]|nr:hypothetical protein [Candidatus Woesearchaeota archaeon]MCF7798775.1 hypothetical protein [Candidatus Woesearchaeota archaeon]
MEYKQRLLKVYYEIEELIKKHELGKISIMGIPINATDYLLKKMPELYYFAKENEEKTKETLKTIQEKINFLLNENDKNKNQSKNIHNRQNPKRKNQLCEISHKTA